MASASDYRGIHDVTNSFIGNGANTNFPKRNSIGVVNKRSCPSSHRIIVKYRTPETGRVQDTAAALETTKKLAQIAGADLEHVRILSGGAQVGVLGMVGLESIQITESVADVVDSNSADPAVEYAELDAVMQIQQIVTEPWFVDQWHLTTLAIGIDVQRGLQHAFGTGIIVAVIDTGFAHMRILWQIYCPNTTSSHMPPQRMTATGAMATPEILVIGY